MVRKPVVHVRPLTVGRSPTSSPLAKRHVCNSACPGWSREVQPLGSVGESVRESVRCQLHRDNTSRSPTLQLPAPHLPSERLVGRQPHTPHTHIHTTHTYTHAYRHTHRHTLLNFKLWTCVRIFHTFAKPEHSSCLELQKQSI